MIDIDDGINRLAEAIEELKNAIIKEIEPWVIPLLDWLIKLMSKKL